MFIYTHRIEIISTLIMLYVAAKFTSYVIKARLQERRNVYTVTRNQISYWELIENKRANMAREQENFRHNRAGEELNLLSLRESERHNAATEGLNARGLAETERHNLIYEGLERERLKQDRELETRRMDLNYEASLYGSELSSAAHRYAAGASAAASRYASDITRDVQFGRMQTDLLINTRQLEHQKDVLTETVRSNQAREAETQRSNLATEAISRYASESKVAIDKFRAEWDVELGLGNLQARKDELTEKYVADLTRTATNLLTSLATLGAI